MQRKTPRPSSRQLQTAQKLRRTMTVPERLLWSRLKRKQINGHRFRRQHPIAGYVVDFVCLEEKVVIELDGLSHVGQAAADAKRQAAIEACGFVVNRFSNDDVCDHLDAVVEAIARLLAGSHDSEAPI